VRLEEQYGHREGRTRTVCFAVAAGLTVGFFQAMLIHSAPLVLAGIAAAFSHLALDAATKSGIHPFRVALPRLKKMGGAGKSRYLFRWNNAADRWNGWVGQAEDRWKKVWLKDSVVTGNDPWEGVVTIGGWLVTAICIFVV
jgi:hypothetical protein